MPPRSCWPSDPILDFACESADGDGPDCLAETGPLNAAYIRALRQRATILKKGLNQLTPRPGAAIFAWGGARSPKAVIAPHAAMAAIASAHVSYNLRSISAPVPVENQIRTYSWCNPPRIGRQRMRPALFTVRDRGASLSKAKCVRVSL